MDRRSRNIKTEQVKRGVLNKVSEFRRAEIHAIENKKQIEEENNPNKMPLSMIAHGANHRSNMVKKAIAGPVTLPTTRGNTDLLSPDVYSPLFQLANLNLPRDLITMNAWNRIFYDTHPIVRNAINLHASYPISKINITHPEKKIQEFFLAMAEKIDLYSVVYGAALEFWKNGETFPYAELDRDDGTWKRITILNPDFIDVKKPSIGDQTIISLKPDAALRRLVSSSAPADLMLKKRLPRHIIDAVKKGHNIPLDNVNISHLKLLSSPYDVRGTSVITSIYKDLMLWDRLRESKFAQADGMVNPLTLVKVGSGPEYRATQGDLEAIRQALEEAQYDKDFKLVTHDGVAIERIGFSGAVLDIAADLEFITNNIYIGLMVPKSIIEQEAVTYASSSIGLEVLRQRYDIFRNMMKKWLEQKIFAPISEIQDFYTFEGGEKVLQVPIVDFNHMNLYDMGDYIQSISNFVGNKQISIQTLCRTLGLSYEEEQRRLKEESIHEVIRTKELESMQSMRLRELENLDPNGPIPEPANNTAAGGGGEGGLPGLELPGMPSEGAPSLPGLSPPKPGGGGGGEASGPPPIPSGPGGPGSPPTEGP